MQDFDKHRSRHTAEYRLNPGAFFMKFVKRNGLIRNAAIILPLSHFQMVLADSRFKGARQGVRVSYDMLNGHYLREDAFLELIRSGYIGSVGATTKNLKILIDGILERGRALVAAIQTSRPDSAEEDESEYFDS